MVLHGQVRNGVVVPDGPAQLPEGAAVRIELLPAESSSASRREGGAWRGRVTIGPDFDELPDDMAEAFGMKTP